jgi:hypothetical protein
MITGFKANVAIDDDGTGAAPGGDSERLDGLVTFNLPEIDVSTFDATELNQQTDDETPVTDPWERELPTGLKKAGPVQAEVKYTKANYNRLVALAGVRGHVFVLTAPDDQSSGSPVVLTTTFTGFVKKLGAVKFEKKEPVSIPVEIVVSKKPTYS